MSARGAAPRAAIVAVLALLALAAATPAAAEDALPPHLRPEIPMRGLVREAARRSPAISELIDRLESLDITVYVRTRQFARIDLDGRVALLSTNGGHRFLVIELACGRSELTQMTALAHELFHAVEIAGERAIVDQRSLAAFYGVHGIETHDASGRRTFETMAAEAAGRRARQELLITKASRNGT